jgi:chitinase
MKLKFNIISILLFFIILFLFHKSDATTPNRVSPKRIIASYNHAEKPSNGFKLENLPWSKMTHLMYSYASISLSDFSVTLPDTFWNALLSCNSLKRNYGVKLLLTIGGTQNSSVFPKVTDSITHINTFAVKCMNQIKTIDLDGVNICYSIPKDSLEGKAYIQLLTSLRHVTDSVSKKTAKTFLLTTSIPGKIDRIDGTNGYIDIARIVQLVDWINIECYDYHTASDSFTSHHAPIYKNTLDMSDFFPVNKPQTYNCDSIIHYLTLSLGIDPEKLNIGTAYYGRSWENVEQNDNMFGLFQKGSFRDSTRGSKPFGVDDFYVLDSLAITKPAFYHYDTMAQAPWLYDPVNKIFHSYENEQSLKVKCTYINNNNIGGICISNVSGDAPHGGNLLTSLIKNILNPETITLQDNFEISHFTIAHSPTDMSGFVDLRGVLIRNGEYRRVSRLSGTYIILKNGPPKKFIQIK